MRLNLKGNNWQVTFCCSVLIMYNIKCNDFVRVLNTSLRAEVAQLVEHRTAMREVVSSTPAGPSLKVIK